MDLTILTAVAVFFHLGTSIAASLLKDKTDQAKIAALNSKVDQIFGIVSALAPAIPTSAPKTLGQGLTDAAQIGNALAGAIALAASPPAPNAGGVGGPANAG